MAMSSSFRSDVFYQCSDVIYRMSETTSTLTQQLHGLLESTHHLGVTLVSLGCRMTQLNDHNYTCYLMVRKFIRDMEGQMQTGRRLKEKSIALPEWTIDMQAEKRVTPAYVHRLVDRQRHQSQGHN